MNAQFHAFLTSAVLGAEWSVSRFSRFNSWIVVQSVLRLATDWTTGFDPRQRQRIFQFSSSVEDSTLKVTARIILVCFSLVQVSSA
jgi:hypothetical protein